MKKFIAIAVGLLLSIGSTYAQFETPNPTKISQLKNKILLVQQLEESTRMQIEFQHNPEQLAIYKASIQKVNDFIKNAVTENFTYCKKIEYTPESKIKQMMSSNKASQYAVIAWTLVSGEPVQNKLMEIYGAPSYNYELRASSKKEGFSKWTISMTNPKKELEAIYSVGLPVAYPSQGDLSIATAHINQMITYMSKQRQHKIEEFAMDVEKYNIKLKDRTLVLTNNLLDNVEEFAAFQTQYPGKSQLAESMEAFDEIIASKDTNYAVLWIVPAYELNSQRGLVKQPLMHLIVEVGSGKVLACIRPTRMVYKELSTTTSKVEAKLYILPEKEVKEKKVNSRNAKPIKTK